MKSHNQIQLNAELWSLALQCKHWTHLDRLLRLPSLHTTTEKVWTNFMKQTQNKIKNFDSSIFEKYFPLIYSPIIKLWNFIMKNTPNASNTWLNVLATLLMGLVIILRWRTQRPSGMWSAAWRTLVPAATGGNTPVLWKEATTRKSQGDYLWYSLCVLLDMKLSTNLFW